MQRNSFKSYKIYQREKNKCIVSQTAFFLSFSSLQNENNFNALLTLVLKSKIADLQIPNVLRIAVIKRLVGWVQYKEENSLLISFNKAYNRVSSSYLEFHGNSACGRNSFNLFLEGKWNGKHYLPESSKNSWKEILLFSLKEQTTLDDYKFWR